MTYTNEDLDRAEQLHNQFHQQIEGMINSDKFSLNPQKISYPDLMNSCLITHLAMLENKISQIVQGFERAEKLPEHLQKIK